MKLFKSWLMIMPLPNKDEEWVWIDVSRSAIAPTLTTH